MALGAPNGSDGFNWASSTSGSGNSWTPNGFSVVCVTSQVTVSTVSGNGLTWTQNTGASHNDGTSYFTVYTASGSGSAGAVTVTLSSSGNASVIHFYYTDGDSIEATATANATNTTMSVTLGTGTAGAVGIMGGWHNARTASLPTSPDESELRFNEVSGGPPSGRQAQSVCYQAYGTTSGGTLDLDLSANASWVAGAFRIKEAPLAALDQTHYRVRSGDTVALNADSGWEAAQDVNATIDSGKFFRVRFKIEETNSASFSGTFKLQCKLNAGAWRDVSVWNTAGDSEAIAIWESDQYANGDATSTELLSKTATGYVNGEGLEDNLTASISLNDQGTELEWCLMINRTFGGASPPTVIADSDTIDLRVVESDGTVLDAYTKTPTITVNAADKYIGGVFCETPAKMLHMDGNGNLYFIGEYDVITNDLMMNKSSDGGNQWSVMDGSNRPATNDFEAGGMVFNDAGDQLHIIHQRNDVDHHIFRVSTHATNADTWGTKDEEIQAATADTDQCCDIASRSDGSLVAVYRDSDGSNQSPYLEVKNGTWAGRTEIDTTASVDFEDVTIIKEAGSDICHIFYKDRTNEDLYHKSLSAADALSSRELVDGDPKALLSPFTTPVAWTSSGNEKVMIVFMDNSDSLLYSVEITNDGSPGTRKVVSDAAVLSDPTTTDSRQPVADIAVDSSTGTVYCVYARTNGDMYRTELTDGGGSWSTDTLERTAIRSTHYLRCNVFTHSSGNGGATVLGYVYAEEVGNYIGRTFYNEYVISSGAADVLNRGLEQIEMGVIASTGGGTSGLHPIEAGYIS